MGGFMDKFKTPRNIHYNDCIFVPKYVASLIEGLGYRKNVRNNICIFLKELMALSKRVDGSLSIHNYVPRDYKKLIDIFGGKYYIYVQALAEVGIISYTGYLKGTKEDIGVCRSFRINPYNLDNINYDISNQNRLYINDDYSNINSVIVSLSSNLISQSLDMLGFTTIKYTESVVETKPNKYYKDYVEFIKEMKMDYDKLFHKSIKEIGNLTIEHFEVNEDIVDGVYGIKTDDSNKLIYLSRDKAIAKGKLENKSLIKHKNNYYLYNETYFINKMKYNLLYADLTSLTQLKDQLYRANRNSTNNRLDTNFTNISSYLLEEIKKDNNLIEIDMVNSQLAITTLLIELDTEDYDLYKTLVFEGEIYEYIQKELNLKTRDDAKLICFLILFSSNSNTNKNVNLFQELFPSVVSWIRDYKAGRFSLDVESYKDFSINLQKKESEIMIDNILPTLRKKKIKAFTKHDSIIIRKERFNETLDIMVKYFESIKFNIKLRYPPT